MPDENDDLPGRDEDDAAAEFDELTELLFEHVSEFAEDEDVPDGMLTMLLLRLSMNMRVASYMASVAKPSAGGLKLDLDRYRGDIENLIRAMKKDAEEFVAQAMEAVAEADAEEDES